MNRTQKSSPSAFIFPNSTFHTSLIKIAKNSQTVSHTLHPSDAYTHELQGVVLDFKDGSTLQTACENLSAQAELLNGESIYIPPSINIPLTVPTSQPSSKLTTHTTPPKPPALTLTLKLSNDTLSYFPAFVPSHSSFRFFFSPSFPSSQ